MTFCLDTTEKLDELDQNFINKFKDILKIDDDFAGEIWEEIVSYVYNYIPKKKIYIHGMIVDSNELYFQYSKRKNSKTAVETFSIIFQDTSYSKILKVMDHDEDIHKKASKMKQEIDIAKFEENIKTISFTITKHSVTAQNKTIGAGYNHGKN